jgi:hypothetical protein
MTRIRRHAAPHPWEPLTMTWREVAESVFRHTEEWLHDHVSQFPDFPQPDPILGVFAREAVIKWTQRRFGLDTSVPTPKDSAEHVLMARLTNGKAPRAISQHPTS